MDNSFSAFTRYDAPKTSIFKGLSIGGGFSRTGGRWMSTVGLVSNVINIPAEVKVQTGTMANAFISYRINKHWDVRVSCANVLNQLYPIATEGIQYCDPSEPRDFTFATSFRF
jgi:outer membrane receptor for ferric coprogen and ferric-rhodotorulic acid